MKVGDALTIDLSKEESVGSDQDNEFVQLGQEDTAVQLVSLEAINEEEEEAHSEGQSVPLVGSRLGVVNIDKDENEDLARTRLQATPWKFFVSTSQPSPSNRRQESRPSFSICQVRAGVNALLKVWIVADRQLLMTQRRHN